MDKLKALLPTLIPVATAIIAATAVVATTLITYWTTKKSERNTELRKEKLNNDKEVISSLSGIIADEGTDEEKRAFSRACNNLCVFA